LFKKILILAVVLCMPYVAFAMEKNTDDSSKSYILMDYNAGCILMEQNAHIPLQVAGITKVMTLLLVCEEVEKDGLKLDEKITISKKASSMGGTQVFLRANKQYRVDELIKSVIIASANDAACALAERVALDQDAFVIRMNEKAKELGLKDTVFTNPTGLYDPIQKTSAYDMAIISRELLSYDLFYCYSDIYMDDFMHDDGQNTEMINANKLVRFYDGADGVATGSSKESGYCLIATAKRGQGRYIYVSLGEKNSNERFENAKSMLDYGFDNFKAKRIVKENQVVKKNVKIDDGEKKYINLYAKKDANVIFEKNKESNVSSKIQVYDDLTAPISKGQKCGEITIELDGVVIGTVDLIAGEAVEKRSFNSTLSKIFTSWLYN